MEPLEVCRLVDSDVPVDCHRDDDIDRADTEGIGQGPLNVSLLKVNNQREMVDGHLEAGSEVVAPAEAVGMAVTRAHKLDTVNPNRYVYITFFKFRIVSIRKSNR